MHRAYRDAILGEAPVIVRSEAGGDVSRRPRRRVFVMLEVGTKRAGW